MERSNPGPRLGPPLGSGKEAQVFEYGSKAAKLYQTAGRKEVTFREAAILAALEHTDIPAPAIWRVQKFGQRWGLVMDRVGGASFAARMRQDQASIPSYLGHMARLHRLVHAYEPVRFVDMTTRLASNIRNAAELGSARRTDLLSRLRRMHGGDRLCHGDFHPENILGEPSQAVIIDWVNATRGDPAADVCRTYLLLYLHVPELAMAYVDTYCHAARITRQRVLRWLPFLAASRLSENVPEEVPRLLELCEM